MQKAQKLAVGSLALIALVALATPNLLGQNRTNDDNSGNRRIDLVDDCDPADPAWGAIGCFQSDGDVTAAEFGAFLTSPLYGAGLVGHPSWRNDPSHVVVQAGKAIQVNNVGGRPHSFTPVAQFGGGLIAGLNAGTAPAPECLPPAFNPEEDPLQAGDSTRMNAEGDGIQRFQCCFHPWMRATVRVVPDDDN